MRAHKHAQLGAQVIRITFFFFCWLEEILLACAVSDARKGAASLQVQEVVMATTIGLELLEDSRREARIGEKSHKHHMAVPYLCMEPHAWH